MESTSPSGDGGLYRGVRLISRYDRPEELASMRAAVDMLPDLSRVRIAQIFCDSKLGEAYFVTVHDGRWIAGLDDHIDRAFRVGGGHNGILFEGAPSNTVCDPWWEDDDDL